MKTNPQEIKTPSKQQLADVTLWVKSYTKPLLHFAMGKLASKETAEDLVQATFETAFAAYDKYSGTGNVKAWLFTILRNKIADFYRLQFRRAATIPVSGLPEEDYFFNEEGHWKTDDYHQYSDEKHLLDDHEFNEILSKCIKNLPPNLMAVIQLKFLEDKKSKEVVKELGLSPTNFWQLMHRAKLQLRKCLSIHWFNESTL
jgi:RNA polymerase sigma-70 factor (ECF subfamily)